MLCTFLCLLICMCVPFAPVFVRAGEEYLNIYIYIHMLPHDQKRNMNEHGRLFFLGGVTRLPYKFIHVHTQFVLYHVIIYGYIMQLLYLCMHNVYPWGRVCSVCI